METRRQFLVQAGSIGMALGLPLFGAAAQQRTPRILLRSSWQTVNIGDIAHTPGVLALIERHLPAAKVSLWPSNIGDGVEAMLRQRFPELEIVQGADAIQKAFQECSFLLHGSGPSLVAANDIARWRTETGKPYGIYGITLPTADARTLDLINGAQFIFFRDTVSLEGARNLGAKCPLMEFGPDGAFAADVRNDDAAVRFLRANGLEDGKFLCCIARLRYTPYWKIHKRDMTPEDERRHAINETHKEQDHAPLRKAIEAVVSRAGVKVLVCPEDPSQMAVGKEMLVDPLPESVKRSVVWREQFWLTDEALSTYVRSAGVFGNEMHSPIMCVGNGIPAIVCRWAEQTSKGFMWRDIGLGDWLFDMDQEADRKRVADAVLAMAADFRAAQAKAEAARRFVRGRQLRAMRSLQERLAKLS